MKQKNFILIFSAVLLCLIFTVSTVWAEKAATLEEVLRPMGVTAGSGRLYITEGATIYIYSLKDYHLIKKFGKEGEGPKEFKTVAMGPPLLAVPGKDKLYVSSQAKVSEFTLDGEFIKETRVTPFQAYLSFGDQFLYTGFGQNKKKEAVIAINLAGSDFKKIKELYVTGQKIGMNVEFNFPSISFDFIPYKDRIYLVAGEEGFVIDVFDKTGKKLYRIEKEHKPMKIGDDYRKKTEDALAKDVGLKAFGPFLKDRVHIRDYFPPIRTIRVTDERIYVLTYKRKAGKSQCLVLDLKGNQKKEVYLDCPENLGADYYNKFDVDRRTFYALIEDVDEESWELHKTAL